MTGADAIEAAMVIMALALIGCAVVSLIESEATQRRERSTLLTTESQTEVGALRRTPADGCPSTGLSAMLKYPSDRRAAR